MNKYELALVVSAKIEDDARTAVVDKAKAIIEKAGGTITNVDEWGKKRLAYEIQKMKEGYYYFIAFDGSSESPRPMFVSWNLFSDIFVSDRTQSRIRRNSK